MESILSGYSSGSKGRILHLMQMMGKERREGGKRDSRKEGKEKS